MRNLLLSEYDNEVANVAAKFGADRGAASGREPQWTAPLGGCTVGVRLRNAHDGNDFYMSPETIMGSSSGLPLAPGHALVILRDTEATIMRAMSAHIALGSIRVWGDDAPCDSCSGRGGNYSRHDCKTCGGTGKRKEPVPA